MKAIKWDTTNFLHHKHSSKSSKKGGKKTAGGEGGYLQMMDSRHLCQSDFWSMVRGPAAATSKTSIKYMSIHTNIKRKSWKMPHYKNGFQNLPLLSSQSCLSSKFSNFNFEWTSHQAFSWLMSFWLCSLILGLWWKHLTSKNNSFIFSTRTFAARGLLPE